MPRRMCISIVILSLRKLCVDSSTVRLVRAVSKVSTRRSWDLNHLAKSFSMRITLLYKKQLEQGKQIKEFKGRQRRRLVLLIPKALQSHKCPCKLQLRQMKLALNYSSSSNWVVRVLRLPATLWCYTRSSRTRIALLNSSLSHALSCPTSRISLFKTTSSSSWTT